MKKFIFNIFLISIISIIFLLSFYVQAQQYPNRPIQLIIPIPAGGGGDVISRMLIDDLEKALGQKIIPVNKPGASMMTGTDFIAKSKKDGYTIGYSGSPIIYSRFTLPSGLPFDPNKDLEPLGLHVFFPIAIAVQVESPWKTYDELVNYAKKNPGRLRVSVPGIGSTASFNVEIAQNIADVQFTIIPYVGGEAVVTALLGGHVEISFDILGKFKPYVEAGKLRLLATSRKIPFFPNLPTLKELGYSMDLLSGWFGFYAPAGIQENIRLMLISAVEKAVNNPETKSKIENLGYVVEYKKPEDMRKLFLDEFEIVKKIADKIKLQK